MSLTRRNLFPAALLTSVAYATGRRSKRPASTAELWARTELFFGTNRPNNQLVTDEEFNEFVNSVVTERFPDGLTLLTAYGQFRNSAGDLVREKSFLLILLYPPEMQDAWKRIQEIRNCYKDAFSQESVLRVDSLSLVSF